MMQYFILLIEIDVSMWNISVFIAHILTGVNNSTTDNYLRLIQDTMSTTRGEGLFD